MQMLVLNAGLGPRTSDLILERTFPLTLKHIHPPNLDAVPLRVLHEL